MVKQLLARKSEFDTQKTRAEAMPEELDSAVKKAREEAIKDGLFGPAGTPVSDTMAARIGDVVAACAGSSSLALSAVKNPAA